jgi:anthranilate phosphoribosyltransferase
MIEKMLTKLKDGKNLSYDETSNSMENILRGKVSDEDSGKFLNYLREKGESDDELLGMLDKMQEFALHISPKNKGTIIDVCGTGGDNLQTFNISTTASFVIAGAGGVVAKHGNRSVSGVSGSADIFEYFGYDLNSEPKRVSDIIEKFGIGFMFAQKFHPAMKNVATARKMIGGRTAFNLLGPLCNPALVKNQMIGVFSDEFLERLVLLLKKRGSENIMTVRSQDGLDELSTTSKNQVYFLKNNSIKQIIVDPEKLGLKKPYIRDIQVKTKDEAVSAFISVLNNSANNAMIEITALNAAGGLIVANIANNFKEGLEIALDTIKSGVAYTLFEDFIRYCGDVKKLEVFNLS